MSPLSLAVVFVPSNSPLPVVENCYSASEGQEVNVMNCGNNSRASEGREKYSRRTRAAVLAVESCVKNAKLNELH